MRNYRQRVEEALQGSLKAFEEEGTLGAACIYAMEGAGRRFRAVLVLMVAEALHTTHSPLEAALAVEYFHTASLVADDLPSMDNAEQRRGRLTTHLLYNESTALLVTYALIAEGYRLLSVAAEELPIDIRSQALITALKETHLHTGMKGVAQGQYLDLHPPVANEENWQEITKKKTTALFSLSFALGWLFGGGSAERVAEVEICAHHFGRAFQIADDIEDLSKDLLDSHSPLNLAAIIGKERAACAIYESIQNYRRALSSLDIATPELMGLADLIGCTHQS